MNKSLDDIKDCENCEHFQRKYEWVQNGERKHRKTRPSECQNDDFPPIVNGERSCALMRSTLCGREASGYEHIDWIERRDISRRYYAHVAKIKEHAKKCPWTESIISFFLHLCFIIPGIAYKDKKEEPRYAEARELYPWPNDLPQYLSFNRLNKWD
ncbi:MAG: hypothetical protein COB09_16985 [Thalassobium sp.]|nr:MAG: hypothetical protein COB09_16985 [Thalassobium sp.]